MGWKDSCTAKQVGMDIDQPQKELETTSGLESYRNAMEVAHKKNSYQPQAAIYHCLLFAPHLTLYRQVRDDSAIQRNAHLIFT